MHEEEIRKQWIEALTFVGVPSVLMGIAILLIPSRIGSTAPRLPSPSFSASSPSSEETNTSTPETLRTARTSNRGLVGEPVIRSRSRGFSPVREAEPQELSAVPSSAPESSVPPEPNPRAPVDLKQNVFTPTSRIVQSLIATSRANLEQKEQTGPTPEILTPGEIESPTPENEPAENPAAAPAEPVQLRRVEESERPTVEAEDEEAPPIIR